MRMFHDRRRKGGSAEASVVFKAPYAGAVHGLWRMKLKGRPRKSGRGKYWDPQGKATAGFLTKAVAELSNKIGGTIVRTLKRGLHLWQGLEQHAIKVMKLAQKKTPVETGRLQKDVVVKVKKK